MNIFKNLTLLSLLLFSSVVSSTEFKFPYFEDCHYHFEKHWVVTPNGDSYTYYVNGEAIMIRKNMIKKDKPILHKGYKYWVGYEKYKDETMTGYEICRREAK